MLQKQFELSESLKDPSVVNSILLFKIIQENHYNQKDSLFKALDPFFEPINRKPYYDKLYLKYQKCQLDERTKVNKIKFQEPNLGYAEQKLQVDQDRYQKLGSDLNRENYIQQELEPVIILKEFQDKLNKVGEKLRTKDNQEPVSLKTNALGFPILKEKSIKSGQISEESYVEVKYEKQPMAFSQKFRRPRAEPHTKKLKDDARAVIKLFVGLQNQFMIQNQQLQTIIEEIENNLGFEKTINHLEFQTWVQSLNIESFDSLQDLWLDEFLAPKKNFSTVYRFICLDFYQRHYFVYQFNKKNQSEQGQTSAYYEQYLINFIEGAINPQNFNLFPTCNPSIQTE